MDVEKEKIKKNVLDDEIIDRVKKGDKEAFNMLIRIYQQKIFKLAYCYLQNREDAMEIVQETFLRVYQKIKQFKKGSNFSNTEYLSWNSEVFKL
jgi:RNA polymerase sigma-70 factor (ECF subfamily)